MTDEPACERGRHGAIILWRAKKRVPYKINIEGWYEERIGILLKQRKKLNVPINGTGDCAMQGRAAEPSLLANFLDEGSLSHHGAAALYSLGIKKGEKALNKGDLVGSHIGCGFEDLVDIGSLDRSVRPFVEELGDEWEELSEVGEVGEEFAVESSGLGESGCGCGGLRVGTVF